MAILSGVNRGNNSPAFRGGDLTAVMGGCEIDLRQAAINGDATIDVFAMWGGIEIRVPGNWTVAFHVTPDLGGVEDKTRPSLGSTVAPADDSRRGGHGRGRGQELVADVRR